MQLRISRSSPTEARPKSTCAARRSTRPTVDASSILSGGHWLTSRLLKNLREGSTQRSRRTTMAPRGHERSPDVCGPDEQTQHMFSCLSPEQRVPTGGNHCRGDVHRRGSDGQFGGGSTRQPATLRCSHDKALTRAIVRAAETVSVRVLDHLIVSAHESFSFRKVGLL